MFYSVNEPSKYEGRSPLQVAVLEAHDTMIDLLLANGATVNVPDIYAQTALHLAARAGMSGQVKSFLTLELRLML